MAAKFEVYKSKGKAGGFRWRLRASNGEIVASGQAYKTRAGARKGIAAVVRAASKAGIEDA